MSCPLHYFQSEQLWLRVYCLSLPWLILWVAVGSLGLGDVCAVLGEYRYSYSLLSLASYVDYSFFFLKFAVWSSILMFECVTHCSRQKESLKRIKNESERSSNFWKCSTSRWLARLLLYPAGGWTYFYAYYLRLIRKFLQWNGRRQQRTQQKILLTHIFSCLLSTCFDK